MSVAVRELEPKELWNHFADLNEVPRPSKKEERVIQFMVDFGKSLGFSTQVDGVGNVIVKKPATAGMENRVPVVLQSHLDMVHQKNADTDFDFASMGIDMRVDGDWVKANGTTLGADNGIGVATIMAILASTDIPHPALEALFTIDEETGMTGALGLKGGLLNGEILLNLDTEEDHELTIGCAGGVDLTITGTYASDPLPDNFQGLNLVLNGLKGGHSGTEIHLGKGNANKLMNRVLFQAAEKFDLRITAIDGGGLRNAIPRESFAKIAVPADQVAAFKNFIEAIEAILKVEYRTTDPDLQLRFESMDSPAQVWKIDFQAQVLRAIYACQNGIFRMCPEIEDLVQTSNNLARVEINNGKYEMLCLTRGSLDTEKMDLAQTLVCTFELLGAKVALSGEYPGWEPRPDAPVIKLMNRIYTERFKSKATVAACHAGLECGILGTNYPDMQMISFGPNIYGAHSPDERVQISSVQKYWGFLLQTLTEIPRKS